MSRRLKDPLLEKYLAGAMDEAARARVEAALADSPQDAARLAELRADSEAFLIAHPPAAFAAKLERPRPWRRLLPWGALAAAALAAGLAVVLRAPPPRAEPPSAVKGAVVLALHRRTAQGSEALGPDAVLHPGDALRFFVRGPRAGFAAVLGRDARGAASVYAPQAAATAAALPAGGALLPDAIALDASPGPETFVVVWAPAPFPVEPVRAALESGAPLEGAVPDGHVGSVRLQKR